MFPSFLARVHARRAIAKLLFLLLALASPALVSNPALATTVHHRNGLAIAPAGLVAAMAKTQAADAAKDPAYRIARNDCASLRTSAKGDRLHGCFTHIGPSFTYGKSKINLRLVAWGKDGNLHRVSLQRTAPEGNRITYKGKNINEWWRVLPMGYEQGFIISKVPHGNHNVVLELRTNRTPKIEHNTLAWGTVHYGKLEVIDAKGKTLSSHLAAKGRTITLAFDARHAHFPVTVDPTVWMSQTLADPGALAGYDGFGNAIALSGNGTTAIVSAPDTNSNAGVAYLYTQSGGTWTLATTLNDPAATASDNFGYAVALDSAGDTALVGAFGTTANTISSAGVAYVYTQSGGSWSGVTAPTATFDDPGTGSDWFGFSVALSGDDTTALVSALATNSSAGAAYVYTQSGGVWATTPAATIADPGTGGDRFGASVALDSTGSTALVGATAGAVSVGWAYVYTQSGGVWGSTPAASFRDPGDAAGDFFGEPVALSGDGTTALVGAYDTSTYAGAAYLYTESAGVWGSTPAASFADPAATSGDTFGTSVALDSTGDTAVVGAWGTSPAGAAYVFAQSAGSWAGVSSPTTALVYPGTGVSEFGSAIAIDSAGTYALVGSNGPPGLAYGFATSTLSASLTAPTSVKTSKQYDAVYTVTNDGASASPDVQVQLPIPSAASYVNAMASPGSCSETASLVTCDLGSIPGSGGTASATLTLNSGTTTGIKITQTASLVGDSPDLAQSATTSVPKPGGGGAFGLFSLFGLLALAGLGRGAVRTNRF